MGYVNLGQEDATKASKPLLEPIPLHGIAPEHMGQCPARHMKTPQKQCLLNLFRPPCHVRGHERRGNGIHHRAGYQPHPLTAYPLFARTRRLAAQHVAFLPTRGKQVYPMSIILSGQRQLSWPVSCRCSLGWEPPVLWGGLGRPWRVRARQGARRATGRARTRQGRGAAPWGCRRAPCGRARDDDYSASGLMADARGSLRRALSALLVVDLFAGAGYALAGSLPRWPRACLRR
jgi:hypothetical protein